VDVVPTGITLSLFGPRDLTGRGSCEAARRTATRLSAAGDELDVREPVNLREVRRVRKRRLRAAASDSRPTRPPRSERCQAPARAPFGRTFDRHLTCVWGCLRTRIAGVKRGFESCRSRSIPKPRRVLSHASIRKRDSGPVIRRERAPFRCVEIGRGPSYTRSMPVCAQCGQDNPEGARFCNACAAPLVAPAGRVSAALGRNQSSISAILTSFNGPRRTPRSSGPMWLSKKSPLQPSACAVSIGVAGS
jgi:hypothetical protein